MDSGGTYPHHYNTAWTLAYSVGAVAFVTVLALQQLGLVGAGTTAPGGKKAAAPAKASGLAVLRRPLVVATIVTLMASALAPVVVNYAPYWFVDRLMVFDFNGQLYPDIQHKEFMSLRRVTDVSDWDEAFAMVRADLSRPYIFTNLTRPEDVKEATDSMVERLREDRLPMKCFVYDREGEFDFHRGHRLINMTMRSVAEVIQSRSNAYVGFRPLVSEREAGILVRNASHVMKKFSRDSTFASNFKSTVVTAPLHSAPAYASFAVQLKGEKQWFFWPQSVMAAKNGGWFQPIMYSAGGNEANLFDRPTFTAVTQPGDVIVFGPVWGHVVVTKPGLNLMTTLRLFTGSSTFPLQYPFHTARGFWAFMFEKAFKSTTEVDVPGDFGTARRLWNKRLHDAFDRQKGTLRQNPVENHLPKVPAPN